MYDAVQQQLCRWINTMLTNLLFLRKRLFPQKYRHTLNTIIGEVIPIALILAVAVLSGLLSNESTERMRLLAGMALAVVGMLCLELLFLQT